MRKISKRVVVLLLVMSFFITSSMNMQVLYANNLGDEKEGGECKISSLVMEGNVAHVMFKTTENAELVVAIYDEDETTMQASGNVEVLPQEMIKDVTLNIETMPGSYVVKAFLVDKNSLEPLCVAYKKVIEEKNEPIEVLENGDKIVDFQITSGQSCILTQQGKLYVWGENEDGQVGNGTVENQLKPVKILDNVKEFETAGYTCGALGNNNDLYMWGYNGGGQVGNGTKTNQYTPTKILENVKKFQLGYSKSSGISYGLGGAILENGDLYMWGKNDYGQIGNGTVVDQSIPTKILENVDSFCLKSDTIGAITQNGDLYMWGYNKCGQVGNGTTMNQSIPTKILENVKNFYINGGLCGAITNNNDLYMWGTNEYGQIGNGTLTEQHSPVKVLEDVRDFYCDSPLGCGAITNSNDLYMWGTNEYGQIGNGTLTEQYSPIKVLGDVKKIIMEDGTVLVLLEDNSLFAWGHNNKGQVGNGSQLNQKTPISVMENVRDFQIVGGTVGVLRENGDLYTWGNCQYARTGIKPLVNQSSPQKLLENVKDFLLDYFICGSILESGDLYMWGMIAEGSEDSDNVLDGCQLIPRLVIGMEKGSLFSLSNAPNAVSDNDINDLTAVSPNSYYNLVIVNSKSATPLFAPTNLVYINQYKSDASGNLHVPDSVVALMLGKEVIVKKYNGPIPEADKILVTSITLNQQNGTVAKNGTLQLAATVAPSTATNKSLVWSSSNLSVATVDQNGLVTAVGAGTATIKVKAQDGSNVEASCVVQVNGGGNNGGNSGSNGGGNNGGNSGSNGGGNSGGSSNNGGNSSGNNSGNTGSNQPSINNPSTGQTPTIKVLYYIVNFDQNGGKNLSRQKMTLLQDDYLGILPKVVRKNYKFKGWYTMPTGGTKVQQKDVFNVSTTLFAQWSQVLTPLKEKISSIKSKKSGTLSVKYKKLSKVDGYEIVYSTKKSFKASATKKKVVKSNSATIKNLKKGKDYYVKIRAYRVDSTGKKLYGSYSAVKKLKTKK